MQWLTRTKLDLWHTLSLKSGRDLSLRGEEAMAECIFCRIARKEASAERILETEHLELLNNQLSQLCIGVGPLKTDRREKHEDA